jgi:hypothetical protein
MAGAKITVKMNPKGLKALKKAQVIAIKKTAMKMLQEKVDMQEIPMNEGTLQNVKTDVDDRAAERGNVQIVSQGPYAARLYYNPQYNFNQEFNTNAKGEWWEDFLTGKNKDRPEKLYGYFYKKASGGFVE